MTQSAVFVYGQIPKHRSIYKLSLSKPGFVYMNRKYSDVGILIARILLGTRNVLFLKSENESSSPFLCPEFSGDLVFVYSFRLERRNGSDINCCQISDLSLAKNEEYPSPYPVIVRIYSDSRNSM